MGTIPPIPTFTAGQELTAAQLNQFGTWISFWQTPPLCRGRRDTDISSTSGDWTLVPLNTEDLDTDAMHSTVTNTSRLTVQTTGYYEVTSVVTFYSNSSGDRETYIRKNENGDTSFSTGTGVINTSVVSALSHVTSVVSPPIVVSLTAGDYLELFFWQNTGGPLSLKGTSENWLQARLVGKV